MCQMVGTIVNWILTATPRRALIRTVWMIPRGMLQYVISVALMLAAMGAKIIILLLAQSWLIRVWHLVLDRMPVMSLANAMAPPLDCTGASELSLVLYDGLADVDRRCAPIAEYDTDVALGWVDMYRGDSMVACALAIADGGNDYATALAVVESGPESVECL